MSNLPPAARLVADLPENEASRLALFTIRRMGAHGLADAHAAHAVLTAFGLGFRRPLLLTRAFMADLARTATRTIAIAPCCCTRLTASEQAMLGLLTDADRPGQARVSARSLLGTGRVDHVVAGAAAIAAAYADAGRPLARDDD